MWCKWGKVKPNKTFSSSFALLKRLELCVTTVFFEEIWYEKCRSKSRSYTKGPRLKIRYVFFLITRNVNQTSVILWRSLKKCTYFVCLIHRKTFSVLHLNQSSKSISSFSFCFTLLSLAFPSFHSPFSSLSHGLYPLTWNIERWSSNKSNTNQKINFFACTCSFKSSVLF